MQPSKIMFWDLEVDNNPYFGAVASPKHPDNYVVMNGYAVEEEPYSGEVKYGYYASKEQAKGWLNIPDDVWLVVAHNLPFELDWAYTQCYDELMKFMKRGGRFWCTAYAEYRLSRQRELYPSLNEVCVKYGGNTKLDLVAVEWGLGKLTSEIDHDLLKDYLIGFDTAEGFQEGDIGNTRLAFYGQYEQVVERGMLDIMFALMDALVFNSVCMSNGLHIDREYAFKRKEELEQRLHELEEHINSLRGNIPEEFRDQFNPNSMYHMSAWLFGGAVNFNGREETFKEDGSPKWEKMSVVYNSLDKDMFVEVPNADITEEELDLLLEEVPLADGKAFMFEPVKYKSGKNKGKIKVERIDSDVRATRQCKVAVDIVGLINLEDYPQEFMSDFLKDYTTKLELVDGKPVISTGAEAIEMLHSYHATPEHIKPLLEVLNEKATVDKILGDYFLVERFNKEGELNFKETKGALKYLTDNDLVHHSLNATSTVTGRLSCTKPNYQTLTDKLDVKTMFTSRFGDRGRMVEIDYSNLEVITLANFSKDEFLMKQIRENMNAHNINSAWKLGITYEEFMVVRNDQNHKLWKQYDEVRDGMKGWEFLYNYGGTDKGLVYNVGCTLAEAEAFIKHKEETLQGVTLFFGGVEKSIRDSAVNVREMRDDRWQYAQEGMYKADGGLEYSYKTSTMYKWERGQKITYQDFKIPQIKNYLIQGESSVFVQVGTGRIIRYLFSQNFFDGKMLPVHTTHDSITLDVHEDVLDKLKNIVYIMEGVNKWMKPLGYDLPLPYPVEATVGMNMQDQQVFN